jgi:hypothetical protein
MFRKTTPLQICDVSKITVKEKHFLERNSLSETNN